MIDPNRRKIEMTQDTNTTSGAADLLDLIEAYAEARHRQGHSSYNAQTAAALQAVKDALAAGQATAAQQGVTYAALPTSSYAGRVYKEGFLVGTCPLYTADKMHAFADATHMLRASSGQAPAWATLPDGWVPLTITHEGQYPEEVAYGPQTMMDRLGKWLGKYFAQAAQAAESVPALDRDSLRHQNKLLAESLGACILASGIVRKDFDGFTGPELLHFGEDLRSMLEVAPQQEAQERIAFKDAHRHLELYEVPDAWGRPMFKHSHVEASWLGWIARTSHGQASSQASEYPALVCDYCGALTPDPWHSSGMLHGKMSKHIHSCDACAGGVQALSAAPAEQEEAAQRLRKTLDIDPGDVNDPLHPRYIAGFKSGHAAGRRRAAPAASPTPPAEQKACDTQLFKFYGVSTTAELIAAQARHIEKLQAKIPPTPSFAPQRVREG